MARNVNHTCVDLSRSTMPSIVTGGNKMPLQTKNKALCVNLSKKLIRSSVDTKCRMLIFLTPSTTATSVFNTVGVRALHWPGYWAKPPPPPPLKKTCFPFSFWFPSVWWTEGKFSSMKKPWSVTRSFPSPPVMTKFLWWTQFPNPSEIRKEQWLETTGTVSIKLAVEKESIMQCSACNDNHYTSNWKSKHVIWAISSDNMKVVSFNLIPWKVCCNQMEWLLFSNRYWCTWNIYFQFDHWLTILNWNRSQLFKASVS